MERKVRMKKHHIKEIHSKKALAVALSKLATFEEARVRVEQYPTDSEIAADMLWSALLNGDIVESETIVADLGAGTGILGIGALILGARRVYFVESESSALETAKKNLKSVESMVRISGEAVFLHMNIAEFSERVDLVVENPPFGTKTKHADTAFLEKAFQISDVVYSFHKAETRKFIDDFSTRNGFDVSDYKEYAFPLKAAMKFHRRRIHRIRVGLWRLAKAKSS